MASTRRERLQTARAWRGFKSARLAAKALGIAISIYGAHERAEAAGGRDYGPDHAKFYARRFGVSPEWLLTGRGQDPRDEFPGGALASEEKAPKVPVVGYVGAGGEVHAYAVARGDLDEVEQPSSLPDTTVAVEIRGDALGPFFNRWLMFYDSIPHSPTPEMIGELCTVGLRGDRVLIKQLKRGRSDGLYNMVSPSQIPIADVELDWAPLETPTDLKPKAVQEVSGALNAFARRYVCSVPEGPTCSRRTVCATRRAT